VLERPQWLVGLRNRFPGNPRTVTSTKPLITGEIAAPLKSAVQCREHIFRTAFEGFAGYSNLTTRVIVLRERSQLSAHPDTARANRGPIGHRGSQQPGERQVAWHLRGTGETHRAEALRKLGLTSSAALVRYAIRNNMIVA
jgi:hypothetical protein